MNTAVRVPQHVGQERAVCGDEVLILLRPLLLVRPKCGHGHGPRVIAQCRYLPLKLFGVEVVVRVEELQELTRCRGDSPRLRMPPTQVSIPASRTASIVLIRPS